MKATLRYFSGTGNSYRVIDTCKIVLEKHAYTVDFASIQNAIPIAEDSDIIGFCSPVYAYSLPRIFEKYLKSLPVFSKKTKAFVLITAGLEDESGYTTIEAKKILESKNIEVVYTDVVQMPSNWTVAMNPPSKEEAQEIVAKGLAKAEYIATAICKGETYIHSFAFPERVSKFIFYKDYYLFKYMGVQNMWRNFRTDISCTGCASCAKTCPTQSITMNDKGRPTWSNTCEQCMRCVNYCPHKAIYQSNYGTIRDKNIYFDHDYRRVVAKEKAN